MHDDNDFLRLHSMPDIVYAVFLLSELLQSIDYIKSIVLISDNLEDRRQMLGSNLKSLAFFLRMILRATIKVYVFAYRRKMKVWKVYRERDIHWFRLFRNLTSYRIQPNLICD